MKAADNQQTRRPCATATQGRFSARLRVLLKALCLWLVEKARVGWRGAFARTAAVLVCALMTSCGGQMGGSLCLSCLGSDAIFYASTSLEVNPDRVVVNPGEEASAQVTLAYSSDQGDGMGGEYLFDNLSVVQPAHPGVTLALTMDPCVLPPPLVGQSSVSCQVHRLIVSAEAVASGTRSVTLSAQWKAREVGDTYVAIERITTFYVSLPSAPPPPPTPGFNIGVGASAERLYATVRGQVPVSIARISGFAEPVKLELDGLGSGITGTFTPNPAPGDVTMLQLDIPAHYAEGGMVPLRVSGLGLVGGLSRSNDFTQPIQRIFTMALSADRTTLTTSAPLDVLVKIDFDPLGPFAAAPPAMTLSAPNLPRGLTAVFLPDATPTTYGVDRTIRRTLRLTTDGAEGFRGWLDVVATATGMAPDLADPPKHPYVTRSLFLQGEAGLQWEYVAYGASYTQTFTENDAVGIAMQSSNQPAIAWLEGRPGNRKVYLKRFDGATFNASPSPGPANALEAPVGDIDEARFAMTAADVAKVAFTYANGAGLALGSAGATWSTSLEFTSIGDERVRSPRIVAGAGGALALSYITQAAAPATGSALFVKRSLGAGSLTPLGGSLNQNPAGRVLRGTSALALRPDGNPVIAWIEQPADAAQPAALWVRAYGGAGWSNAVAVPVSPVRALVPSSVQIAIEPAGTVVVAWLEGSPARLMVARGDLASGTWLALSNTGNGEGSLNVEAAQPANDVSLTIDAMGRIVVAWTERSVFTQLFVKRQNADTTWGLLGSALSTEVATKSPRIVGDTTGQLYVTYTRFYGGGDLMTIEPDTNIFVARWRFP